MDICFFPSASNSVINGKILVLYTVNQKRLKYENYFQLDAEIVFITMMIFQLQAMHHMEKKYSMFFFIVDRTSSSRCRLEFFGLFLAPSVAYSHAYAIITFEFV